MLSVVDALRLTFTVAHVAAAATIYLAAPQRPANRLLAAAFMLEPVMFGAPRLVGYLSADPSHHVARMWLFAFVAPAWTALYVGFLGTLPSPWSAPLRMRHALTVVAAYPIIMWSWMLLVPTHFIGPHDGSVSAGPFYEATRIPVFFLMVYALIVAISAWRRAPLHSATRSRSRIYAFAFCGRDLLVMLFLLFALGLLPLPDPIDPGTMSLLPSIAFLPLFTYGILKHQLFDIDLKIKWTINRSTLVALFLSFFFIVSELAAVVFAERIGTVLGIVAAGALLFALSPLQRFADRVADTAMPHVQDTAEYRLVRGQEVYQAALEEALADGMLSPKDRNVLATLADRLGLGARETLEIERLVGRSELELNAP